MGTISNALIRTFKGSKIKPSFADSWTWTQPEVSGEAPKARTGQSAVAHGSRLVVFGGWDYSDSYSSSKVYNDVSVLDTGK